MKVKGVDVCFGKVVKLTLYAGSESVTLLYAPQLNELYNANIDIDVEDIANPMRKNNELGFTAQIKIVNPPRAAAELLSRHTNWISNAGESEEEFSERAIRDLGSMLIDYYKNRVRCRVEVGYWDYDQKLPTDDKGWQNYEIPGLVQLFDGYVNGSALYHQDTDDVLQIACHNFNADQISTRAIQKEIMCVYPDIERKLKLTQYAEEDFEKRSGKGKRDWESMLRQLISWFSVMRPNPKYGDGVQTINGMPSSIPPEIPVSKEDRTATSWIKILYINSPEDLRTPNEALRTRMQNFYVGDFFTNAGTLADMITDLCNFRNANVNWFQYDTFDGSHEYAVYFIYPRGAGLAATRSNNADIKIVNYQNLLESPTASASGSIRIRMFLNTDCIPLKRIALIIDENVGSATGTGDSFVIKADRLWRSSMGVQGKLSPYIGAQQLSNSWNVYMQEVAAKDIQDKGYLFNTGFPIIKCTHKISTLGDQWETIVETAPVYQGLNVNFGSK